MEFIVVIDNHVCVPTITSFTIFDGCGRPRRAIVDTVRECIAIATSMNNVNMPIRINCNSVFMTCLITVVCGRLCPLMIDSVVCHIRIVKVRKTTSCDCNFLTTSDPTRVH